MGKDEEFQQKLAEVRSMVKGVQLGNFTCTELQSKLQEFREYLKVVLNN